MARKSKGSFRTQSTTLNSPEPSQRNNTFAVARARRELLENIPEVRVERTIGVRPRRNNGNVPTKLPPVYRSNVIALGENKKEAERFDVVEVVESLEDKTRVPVRCKDRPKDSRNKGAGQGRAFVPWCR